MSKQDKAFVELFKAILEENGYYDKLRYFMKRRGYSCREMAEMLNDRYEYAPEGMSVYWYMDSMEELIANRELGIRDLHDVRDIVEYLDDHWLWKVC